MKPETKYKGSLILAAIGDALGWITEFEKSTEALKSKYNTDYITDFHSWKKEVGGRFNGYVDYLEKGSYSDDTQLMLSVARSINPDGFVDNEYFSKIELPNWLQYSRGAGRTIKTAARKIQRKSAIWNNNFFSYKIGNSTIDYRECGANGAAMRILPIALANFGDIEKIKEEIFGNSIITHGHPRAILGAMLYGFAIHTILKFRPESFNYESFLTELGKDIHNKLSVSFLKKPNFAAWEKEWNKKVSVLFLERYNTTMDETQRYLRDTFKSLKQSDDDREVLEKLGCFKPETKGSGLSTVIAGIYLCCKYSNEPIKAIEQAVNMIGTDTDSIAAFTGGLVGALHGTAIIPDRLKNVQDYHYLIKTAIRLLEISESRAKEVKLISNHSDKTLNNVDSDDYIVDEKVFFLPLGRGTIKNIDRQDTLTKGKYNLIIDVDFEIGQSCRFAKILDKLDDTAKQLTFNNEFQGKENFINSLNLNSFAQGKIQLFMKSLNRNQIEEFKEILKLLNQQKKQ